MEILTGRDMARRRAELEETGANLLGKLMFAFGRLEHALSLAVRSVDDGKYLDGSTFHARLASLERAVDARHRERGLLREPYDSWIAAAHRLRQVRNDMVHGRWAPDAGSLTVVNVVVSGDLKEQRTIPYSLSQLEQIASDVTRLQADLSNLVMRNEL